MSIFHATALSKALSEALDIITSDPYWIANSQPRQLVDSPTIKRNFLSRTIKARQSPVTTRTDAADGSSEFRKDLRYDFERQHARCQLMITALDAYISFWGQMEKLSRSSFILNEKVATTLNDMKQVNNKTMFGLRRLLKTSLQMYGEVISKHKQSVDPTENHSYQGCRLSFNGTVDINENHYCFHHPFGSLDDGFFRDKLTVICLSRIRHATSVARFLLTVFRHAAKYPSRSKIEVDDVDTVTVKWHKQIDAVEELDQATSILRSDEKKFFGTPGRADFFDQIDLSHKDPLPLTAFVSQYLKVLADYSISADIKSRARKYGDGQIPEDLRPISNLITEIRGNNSGNNVKYLEKVDDLRQAHEELIKKAQKLVSEIGTTTKTSTTTTTNTTTHGRLYGTTTVESGATAVLGDIIHNYIFGGSSNVTGMFYPQGERPEFPASGSAGGAGPVPNPFFAPPNAPAFPFGPQHFDSQVMPQTTPSRGARSSTAPPSSTTPPSSTVFPPSIAPLPPTVPLPSVVPPFSTAPPASKIPPLSTELPSIPSITGFPSLTAPLSSRAPPSSTAADFVRSLFDTNSFSTFEMGGDSSGNRTITSPQQQDSQFRQTPLPAHIGNSPHFLATAPDSDLPIKNPEPTDSNHDLKEDQPAPPPYTPGRNPKAESFTDTKPTASTPVSSPISEQQLPECGPRSPIIGSTSSTVVINRRPVGTSLGSGNNPVISHDTSVLFSDYFESIASTQRNT